MCREVGEGNISSQTLHEGICSRGQLALALRAVCKWTVMVTTVVRTVVVKAVVAGVVVVVHGDGGTRDPS